MTSRESVLRACNHLEPDRVPIDFSGHPSSGIAAIAYAKLRDLSGASPEDHARLRPHPTVGHRG